MAWLQARRLPCLASPNKFLLALRFELSTKSPQKPDGMPYGITVGCYMSSDGEPYEHLRIPFGFIQAGRKDSLIPSVLAVIFSSVGAFNLPH